MLILARHGQTAVNAGGRLQGRIDAPLTELGHQQASAIGRALAGADLVVSSPLRRALDTAAYIGSDVVVDERWIELDYGEFDDVSITDVGTEVWDRWRSDPTFAPPGGESLLDVGARVRSACEDLVEQASRADVVVVTHVSPVKAAVAWALAVGDDVAWRMFLDVAALARISIGPRGPSLLAWNDRCHLASAL